MSTVERILILDREPDPDSLLFYVMIDGRHLEHWSLERIKYEVGAGAVLTERGEIAA